MTVAKKTDREEAHSYRSNRLTAAAKFVPPIELVLRGLSVDADRKLTMY